LKILLVNPPLADPSGPYPAICYLAGYLDTIGHRATLADASLALLLQLLSPDGVRQIAAATHAVRRSTSDVVLDAFLAHEMQFADTISTAVAVLQGRDHGALARASRRGYFPPPLDPSADWALSSYLNVRSYEAALGALTTAQRQRAAADGDSMRLTLGRADSTDAVRFRASRVVSDLCRVIRRTIDPDFQLDAYAEKLSDDPPEFGPIADRLKRTNVIDMLVDNIAADLGREHEPDVLGLSVPFAGNLYGALRIAAMFKTLRPDTTVVLGGGWVNTQLRSLSDPGIFDYVDYVTLDDGERPLACILEMLGGHRPADALKRTYRRENGRVRFIDGASEPDVPFAECGTPTYRGLPLNQYLVVRTSPQSFRRIAGRRWNKLTLAHGCYWKKCAFCDTSLDYIDRYDPASVDVTIDRIKALQDETGESGFHFVDEAMPPATMARLAERLVAEHLDIAWWGNVRFDKALLGMAPLLASSGCIGITGGLEVASDRVLALMDKGVSLGQAARVCAEFAAADIFTHAYLIYGFPTETAQETIDALEFVRQLFAAGALKSAYWHEFVLTAHSPIARHPAKFGIRIPPQPARPFSNYLLDFDETNRIDHTQFKDGLQQAVQQYQLGIGLDDPLEKWFGFAVPATAIPKDFVCRLLPEAGHAQS
jgi:radical SAM superfamily enzyme YgiQ (UPF0313 family)